MPNSGATKFFANISPKPSITPLMKGSTKLIAIDEATASTRARGERPGVKMESVTDGGGPRFDATVAPP